MIRAFTIILAVVVVAVTVLLRQDRSLPHDVNAASKQDTHRPTPLTPLPISIEKTIRSENVEPLPTIPTPRPTSPSISIPSIPNNARRIRELQDVGVDSAIAASETFIWATLQRKTDMVADMVVWKVFGDSRRAAAIFMDLPEHWRREMQSPERLIAIMHQNENAKFEAVEVIGHRTFGPADEEVKVRWFAPDGSTKEESMLMTKVGGAWRRDQQPATLKRLVDHLSSQSTQGR